MTPDDLISLNEEIAAMARAGLPLDQGLAALADEMGRGKLQRVTAQLAADLRAGQTLPQALQRRGRQVPAFYAGLVEAGVHSGRVAEVLATLTVYARTVANVRATIVDAALYPAVVIVFAVTILAVVICYLMPQYDQMFREFNMRLPAVTEAVLAVSRRPGLYLAAPVLAVAGVILLVRAALGGTERGRCYWARLVYAVPVVGTLIRAARLGAFTELLAILVEHDVPLPRAFELAGRASSDPFLAVGARRAQQDLEAGQPLGPALRQRLMVPELIAWMTAAGEQRGDLGPTLHHVAELYRRQVERRAGLLRSVLPPFLIIATAGVLVGVFIVALMLPMIKLLEGLSR
jgi:type II secretory pathway component PulF